MDDMKDARRLLLTWLGAVGIITLAIIPVRLYLLSVDDWLIGALSMLALAFFVAYFLIAWFWKPEGVGSAQIP